MVKLSEGWGKLRPSKFLLPDITDFFTSLGGCTLSFGISQVFIAEFGAEEGVLALAAGLGLLMRFPLFLWAAIISCHGCIASHLYYEQYRIGHLALSFLSAPVYPICH